MLMLISPAKTLDETPMKREVVATQPRFMGEVKELVREMQTHSSEDISKLMHVSDKIADLNWRRYQDFRAPFSDENAKPALFSFKGDVYVPIEANAYDDEKMAFANDHLRILSGLYGVLRPLDYLYPYRLEMGTKLATEGGKNLYEFWGSKVTDALNEDLVSLESDVVLNLASTEYSKVVKPKNLNGRYVSVEFKEKKGDDYKVIGIHAKKARGMMVDYIIKHGITQAEGIIAFDREGYVYAPGQSSDVSLVFTRG